MSTTTGTVRTPSVPFLDLKAEYAMLKAAGLEKQILETLSQASFVEGAAVQAFEKAFAAYCETSEGVAVDSGTAALHLALLAANIGRGDEVIVPDHTFIATAAAVAAVGATPVFVDVDATTWEMKAELVEAAITPRTRAVIVVHLYGLPAAIAEITQLCQQRNLVCIEDAAQAHGARVNGRRIGSWGKLACFSFYPAKNLGAFGDGGAVVTSDAALAERIRRLRNHGRISKYEHAEVGFNYRMDEMQGVVLGFKLNYLDRGNERRRAIAQQYRAQLANTSLSFPEVAATSEPVYHLFPIKTDRRDELQQFLRERNIDSGQHYPLPLHLQPAFAHLRYRKGQFPVAESIGQQELSLPIGPLLSDAQVETVSAAIQEFFRR